MTLFIRLLVALYRLRWRFCLLECVDYVHDDDNVHSDYRSSS